MASCFTNICAKNRQNLLILFKVTVDNVGVPFLRHSVVAKNEMATICQRQFVAVFGDGRKTATNFSPFPVTCSESLPFLATVVTSMDDNVRIKFPHTDAEAHSFCKQRAALAGNNSQCWATWVVEHSGLGIKRKAHFLPSSM